MSIVQFDSQKIEQLLNSATTSRQRKMYQALLDKARSQECSSTDSKASRTTPETEKKAKTQTNQKTETISLTKTAKKKKKATRKSATTEASTPTRQSTTSTQLTLNESDVPPQTEPSPSQSERTQHSSLSPRIFQALGAVLATPYLFGERLKVKIEDGSYDLSYNRGYQRQAYMSLLEELEENGSKEMFLRLYPQATFDQSSAQPILSFSLVNFSLNCEKINNYPKGFVLRGIWQYIPHSKSTVISIYRNREQLGFFKKLKGSRQFNFAKPHHIPVVWDGTVEPFKFNPQAEKDSQMPRYFVEVRAIFKDGLYVVEEMLREPTVDIPKFIKLPKRRNDKEAAV